jgi:hypothetical protein
MFLVVVTPPKSWTQFSGPSVCDTDPDVMTFPATCRTGGCSIFKREGHWRSADRGLRFVVAMDDDSDALVGAGGGQGLLACG